MKNRTLVIGDIHNCYLGLKQAIERAILVEGDTLIFLGDYFDGWSQAREVMEYLWELNEKYCCIFIKGNHDEWVQDILNKNQIDTIPPYLLEYGLDKTVVSFRNWFKEDSTAFSKVQKFLNNLNVYYIDKQNRLFLHAGFVSETGVATDNDLNLYWDRSLQREVFETNRKPERINLYKEIYIGHTPTTRKWGVTEPMNRYNLWNMDTGAAFTGKVSVMDIDSKEFWQSDLVQTLYPNEDGRN